MIQALVFDFDGLILDTEAPMFQSWQEIYRSYGRQLDLEKWVSNIGKGEDDFDPAEDLAQMIGQRLDRDSLVSLYQKRKRALIDSQPVLPGVGDYLKGARRLGLKVGLASCSSCEWVTEHLDRLELLEYFDCIRAAEHVRSLKPDPEVYLSTLEYLEVQPEQAIAFEDSTYGALAARRAGMYCVVVPNPLSRLFPVDHADVHLDSLGELPLEKLLQRIETSMGYRY